MTESVQVTLAGVDGRRHRLEQEQGEWRPRSLVTALDDAVDAHPDREFVVAGNDVRTYRELAARSEALARGLVDGGVDPGDRVALVLPNWAETIAVRFAVARAGAIAVPVNPALKAEELAYVLEQCGAAAVVIMQEFRGIDGLDQLDRVAPGWERGGRSGTLPSLRLVVVAPHGAPLARSALVGLDDLVTEPDPDLDAEVARRTRSIDPADTATIFYTSGTTGRPKGVISTHDMELRSAYGSAYTRAFEDGRRIYFALPLHHVFAYVEGMLAALFVGGCVITDAAFDPKGALDAIARHRAGEALFVPTMSLAVVDAARRGDHDLASLHSVMSAASSAPARLWNDLREVLGLEQLVTAYGMTETSAATTFTMPGDPVDNLVGTVGRPKLGGVAATDDLDGRLAEYRTVDSHSASLPDGAEGELVTRGPIVTRGYYGKPEETAETVLPGGWLRSGDLGLVRDDGYLVLTGRSKDLYKCGGELVMPTEVEERLNRLPDVVQAHVVGVPDELMGEVGCAWIVTADDAEPPAEEALIEYCRAELARFKVPKYVRITTAGELPLTASGKVQKFKLAERAVDELGLSGEAPSAR